MTGSKDIALLSFFFSAGTAAGVFTFRILSDRFFHPDIIYHSASAAFLVTGIAIIWNLKGKQENPSPIILLYLLTGFLCAAIHVISSIGTEVRDFGEVAAEAVKSRIDSLPFSSTETSGLVKALITGDRSGLDRNVAEAFRASGAAHILALSGLHLGIIYAMLLRLTSIFGNSQPARMSRSMLIIVISGFYTLATGACDSLVRAFLFILLNETARLIHRRISPARVFCAALMIQLAIKPTAITSVGFQLSYLAMAGIFFLYPKLKNWYPDQEDERQETRGNRIGLVRRIWNAAAFTIACQVFTGPAAWFYFRTFPSYFLITNLLSLPVTNILMILAVSTLTLSFLGINPSLLVYATDLSASVLIFIMEVISGL